MKYVDLNLPSGTQWCADNEDGFYFYHDAVDKYGEKLPSKEQWEELIAHCTWKWNGTTRCYDITGTNGNSISLPANGYGVVHKTINGEGMSGYYWSSTPYKFDFAWYLGFVSKTVYLNEGSRSLKHSVRLVANAEN